MVMEERTPARQRGLDYSVERAVLDEESLEEVAQRRTCEGKPALAQRLRGKLSCSAAKLKHCLFTCIPVLSWLPRYSFRECALGDFFSGISVGIMHLPQGMAYALLASVPPVFGLYSSFYPILVYFIFGTSRHISVGTFAVMSVMIGSVVERLAPDSDFSSLDNVTNETLIDVLQRDAARIKVAAAVTFLSGLFQVALGLVQFGFVVTYLSEPLVRGYTTAAAIHVIVSQLKYVFGINPNRYSGPLSMVYTVIEVCALLPETNVGTLVVSIVSLVVLLVVKKISTALSHKLPIPIPIELILVIVSTVITAQVQLDNKYGVQVVGEIPQGLQAPVFPDSSLFVSVVGDAFAIAVVGYAIAISLGKIFALKYGYQVDSNQELVALGLSNSVGGVFQCFAISCSMSRTLVQESSGGHTQVAGALSALVILVIILQLGKLFQQLPKAVLSAIVIINLQGMMRQFTDIRTLWRSNKVDMLVWVVTLVFTLLLNLDLGLAASIAFAMLTVIFRTQLPQYSLLGRIAGTELYRSVEEFAQAQEIPGVKIFRSSATLYFANAEMYEETLKKKVGINIAQLLRHKKKLAAKEKRREKQEERRAKKEAKKNQEKKGGGATDCVESEETGQEETGQEETGREETGREETVQEETRREGTQRWSNPLNPHSIILDLSPVNFLDTVSVKKLKNIVSDYREVGVEVYLAGCQSCVVGEMERGGFFLKALSKACLFVSVHDAVLHCLRRAEHGPLDSPAALENTRL
ncbi:solute carrier family 26 member 6 [Acipenser ruthenus]|uniref:solute carrier family 26 member 6 n=1 Tax=Acipenser ruthenus TaxID=7906 RepID=UPI002741EF9B|nr:solute carrier family 26 member 6 [Acipenser ruthenus]